LAFYKNRKKNCGFSGDIAANYISRPFTGQTLFKIAISCLGLVGLASFVAEQRTKEVGVRKVMGASVFVLWRLLSAEFVLLVIISCVVAMPLSAYYLSGWLQKYEYRTGLSWWIFAGTGLGAFVIAVSTVSYQALKAALANPVRSLRME